MSRPGAALALLAVAVSVLSPNSDPAHATQVQVQSVEELGKTSERIVRATVTSVRPYWNDTHTRILTETTVRVSEDYKGAGPATVRLVQFGGAVDGVRMTVAGSLDWNVGEEVVLFLQPSLPDRHRVNGFNQGKYSIERDPATSREFVRRAGAGPAEAPTSQLRLPLQELIQHALPDQDGGK